MNPQERRHEYVALLKKLCFNKDIIELLKEVALDDSLKKSKHLDLNGVIPETMPLYDKLLYDLRSARKMIIAQKIEKGEPVDENI